MATIGTNHGDNARARKIVAILSFLLLTNLTLPVHAADDAAAVPFIDITTTVSQDDLRDRLANTDDAGIHGQVVAFYAARDYAPVWTDTGTVGQLEDVLAHADDQGLRRKDYAVDGNLPGPDLEIALTEALFRYAHDVHVGRVAPRTVYRDVRLPESSFDLGPPLNDALKRGTLPTLLAALPPRQPEYRGLVVALAQYRAIAKAGGWPVVKAKDPDSLAHRLALEDIDFATVVDPTMMDLAAAVSRFQERNGLPVDGQAGANTLKALNVPVSARIKAILASMERWRWMPRTLESHYIRVNVPDQSVDYIDNAEVVLHSKVVIGKPSTPTPILRTEVTAVVANPAWDIPGDIAARQVLPHLRHDKNYLQSRGYILVSSPGVDWRKLPAGQVALQQPPGPDNVLGKIMLDMPNDFDVYLHDTPNKKLFTQDNREASNGCIRVEEIASLASLALTNDAHNGDDKIDEAIGTGQTTNIPLDRPLPVYVMYSTAVADADGNTGFRPDRYNRDAPLLAAMAKPAAAAPNVMTAQAPLRKKTHPDPSPESN
jgi:murein L,D-transpeptidase YcbB/YkuD